MATSFGAEPPDPVEEIADAGFGGGIVIGAPLLQAPDTTVTLTVPTPGPGNSDWGHRHKKRNGHRH
ncbi:MAG: hypothetical protein AAB290_06790 [Candidatus Eisenbacteria bacterium]